MGPCQRVDARARHVLAVVDERLPFAELEYHLKPVVQVLSPSVLEIQKRLHDAIPEGARARTMSNVGWSSVTNDHSRGRRVTADNALQHMVGYFKDRLDRVCKAELLAAIEDDRTGLVPLIVPTRRS